jgi:amidase
MNPLDPELVPGGSSSGSAVAVANDEADVGLGSDTGGSIRIPAACCGIAGLKTTHGRIPLQGVWPLAPSMDTIGPLARDAGGLIAGMRLLEPGFAAAAAPPRLVGRVRLPAEALIDEAIDGALRRAGFEVVELSLPEWESVTRATGLLLGAEAAVSDGDLYRTRPEEIGEDVRRRLAEGSAHLPEAVMSARSTQSAWKAALAERFRAVDLLALPTLADFPPRLDDAGRMYMTRLTSPINLAGVPAVALPVPSRGRLPASLQLVGPPGSEELLLAAALAVEAAV